VTRRAESLAAAAQISAVSCIVSLSVGAIALLLGTSAGSVALIAFGLESFVDGGASAMLFWRFGVESRQPHRAEHLERRASRIIGAVLLVVAVYLVAAAVRSLVAGPSSHPQSASIVLAAASVAVLPLIARRKLVLSGRLASRSLHADGVLTLAGAVLAGVTLAAILIARYSGFETADPLAALIVALALMVEAFGALKESRR
jgi:divalent metal cation (Fe/Co/Zn/Cd) transporter